MNKTLVTLSEEDIGVLASRQKSIPFVPDNDFSRKMVFDEVIWKTMLRTNFSYIPVPENVSLGIWRGRVGENPRPYIWSNQQDMRESLTDWIEKVSAQDKSNKFVINFVTPYMYTGVIEREGFKKNGETCFFASVTKV